MQVNGEFSGSDWNILAVVQVGIARKRSSPIPSWFESWGTRPWRARAYNGGLGAMPPVGSRGKAPRQAAKPPGADEFLANETYILQLNFQ